MYRFEFDSTCPKCRKHCNRWQLQQIHLDFTDTQNESQTIHKRKRKQKNKKGTRNEDVNVLNSSPRYEPNPEQNPNWNISMRIHDVLQIVSNPKAMAMIQLILLLIIQIILTNIVEIYHFLTILRVVLVMGIFLCILNIISSHQ